DPPKITLTVTGNYVGMGGAMIFNAYLGDSTSVSDSLVIDGGSATGNTSVFIASLGGQGAQTTGNGILLVDAINGGTTTATAFALGAPVIAGPYEYLLYRGGVSGDLPDDWFLRSTLDCELDPNSPACRPNFRSETSLYTAIPSLALNYGNMLLDSLDERMGGQRSLQRFGLVGQTGDIDRRAWGRIIATRGSRDGGSSGIYSDRGPSYNHHTYALQVGLDVYAAGRANGGFDNAGFYFANGETSATVRHFDGTKAGTNRTNATTLGGYWTHFGKRGWYLDTVVQGTWYDNKAYGRLSSVKTKGFGLGASLEAGYPVLLNNGVMLQPQAQLTYQTINLDDSYDMAAKIGFDNVQSLIARLGARLSKTWTPDSSLSSTGVLRKTTAWGRVSFINEFLGRPETRFSSANGDVPFRASTHGAGFKIDAGIDTEIAKGVSFYGSLQFQREFGGSDYAFGGKIGLKAVF
ncbi:MAG: autotransporter outer membrane beta-barrel domain-containing protein, partial [Betaproteobacteria bacterium]|nr:autotransporter outer membrane beta-barrel domain-containing protein [Betaproteobacteria bacterium]